MILQSGIMEISRNISTCARLQVVSGHTIYLEGMRIMTQAITRTTSSTAEDFHRRRYDSIQALRGITALFIVLEHVRFLNCGAFGVDIFFCISGFMIMLSTHADTSHFLGKRLIRILPLYYLMTLGTYLALLVIPDWFTLTRAEPAFLMKSLLFIPFDIGGGVLQPLMRIGWTVNCEIFFYLVFGLSMKLNHKCRGLICSFLLLIVIGLAQILPVDFAPLAFYGNPVMADFLLGIFCYYAAKGLYKLHATGRLSRLCLPVSLFLTVCGFVVLVATKPHIDILGFRRPLFWGLPAAIIVLSAFVAGLYLQMPHPLVQLGDISFSLYLMHYYPVALLDRAVFDFSRCTPLTLLGVAASLAVSVTLALISWLLIEKGLSGWLRCRLLGHS